MSSRCPWCCKYYSSAGAYANHISKKHHNVIDSRNLKRRRDSEAEIDEVSLNSGPGWSTGGECPLALTPGFADARKQNSSIQKYPPNCQAGFPLRPYPFTSQRSSDWNPLYPFQSANDYKLARFFSAAKVPKTRMDEFFKDGLANTLTVSKLSIPSSISFCSGYTMYKCTHGLIEDPPWKSRKVDFILRKQTEFYYRDLLACIRYLLRQKAYRDHLVWAPTREQNTAGERIYSELHTAEWWWDTQVIYLSNFCRENKLIYVG